MFRRLLLAGVLALGAAPAWAMSSSQVPAVFPIPFAADAGGGYIRSIPQNSQIGIQAGAASLHDGFPPVTFLPIGAGGTPPFGSDMNGILNQLSSWAQWGSLGGPNYWSSALSSAIGGYPAGAVVNQAGNLGNWWMSIVENNTTDPDTGGAGWIGFGISGQARIVTASGNFTTVLNDGSIGLNRTTSVATSATTLPSGAPNAKTYTYQDLAGNFATFPLTVTAPSGTTIAGLASWTANVNRQSVTFTFYSSGNIWGVKF